MPTNADKELTNTLSRDFGFFEKVHRASPQMSPLVKASQGTKTSATRMLSVNESDRRSSAFIGGYSLFSSRARQRKKTNGRR
jgi:hypothetical protein